MSFFAHAVLSPRRALLANRAIAASTHPGAVRHARRGAASCAWRLHGPLPATEPLRELVPVDGAEGPNWPDASSGSGDRHRGTGDRGMAALRPTVASMNFLAQLVIREACLIFQRIDLSECAAISLSDGPKHHQARPPPSGRGASCAIRPSAAAVPAHSVSMNLVALAAGGSSPPCKMRIIARAVGGRRSSGRAGSGS